MTSAEHLLAAYEQLYDDAEGADNEPVYPDWKGYLHLRANFHVIFKVCNWNEGKIFVKIYEINSLSSINRFLSVHVS